MSSTPGTPADAARPPVDAVADAVPGALPDAAVRVLRQFRIVFSAVRSHFREVEKRAGVGGAQLWALSLIDAQPGLGVNALARAMDIRQTTASNLVRTLAAASLVVAQRNGADRRRVELRILPAGQAVLRKAPPPFSGVVPVALAGLDAETLQRLETDLGRLIEMLHADRRAAGVPLAQI